MRKARIILCFVLFALTVFLPLAIGISFLFGYEFHLTSYPAFAIVTILVSVACCIICSSSEKETRNEAIDMICNIICFLQGPFSLVNTIFYLFKDIKHWYWVGILMSFYVIASCYITLKGCRSKALRILSLFLTILAAFPVIYFGTIGGFLSLVFGDIGINTVVKTEISPNEEYIAEVVNSDEGALGGDTLVYVYKGKKVNALLFTLSPKAQLVYKGEWGEFEDMDIQWKDDHCLLINSVEYPLR